MGELRAMLRHVAWVFFAASLALAVPMRPALAEALPLAEELTDVLAAASTDDEVETLTVLEHFYSDRGHRPLWVQEGAAGSRAEPLARALAAIGRALCRGRVGQYG